MVGNNETQEFVLLEQVFNEAVKISIAGGDKCPVIVIPFDHRVEHQFRINISFHDALLSFLDLQRWLKDHDEARCLECGVEALIARHIADEDECLGHIVLVTQVLPETPPIENPPLIPNGEVYVLAIDEGTVIRHRGMVHRSLSVLSSLY